MRFREDDSTDEASPGAAKSSLAPLFEEVAVSALHRHEAAGNPPTELSRSDLTFVETFWRGIEETRASELIRTPEGEAIDAPAVFATHLVDRVPSLERVMRELFLSETERVIGRRTPDFRTRTDTLPFIRGSLTRRGRQDIATGRFNTLECEFTDIDHDHWWQQLIRSAVRQVAVRDVAEAGTRGPGRNRVRRCRNIDNRLADVTLRSPSDLLGQRFDTGALGKNRHSTNAARLAVAILERESPGGYVGRSTHTMAAATGIRISSALMFERLLAEALGPESRHRLQRNREPIYLLKGGGIGKRPDLIQVDSEMGPAHTLENCVAVVDAKNKISVPTSPRTMAMADQYQQFAYAAVTGKPTVFVFAAPCGEPPSLPETWSSINVPGSMTEVAVASVGFPSPSGGPWRQQVAPSLAAVLNAVAARRDPVRMEHSSLATT